MRWDEAFQRLTADIPKIGVLHVGAHDGREVAAYSEFPKIILVEPNPVRAAQLRRLNVEVVEAAVTSKSGPVVLNLTGRDEGSSLLKPLYDYSIVGGVWVDTATLDDFTGVNVLVVDTQGSEVDVLTSGSLDPFNLIVCEVSDEVRYVDGACEADVLEVLEGWDVVARFDHPTSPGVADLVFRCGS